MANEPKTDDDLQKKVKEAKRKDDVQQKADKKKADSQGEVEKLKETLARCMADMQNYKRRADEEKMQFVKYANTEFLKLLLPIIDNFDRACRQVPESLAEDAWAKGVISTHDELIKAIEKIGVKKMTTIGQKLDLTRHEAMLSGAGEKDVIIEEFEPGYLYNEATLKAAKVKVGDGS